jgi:hypothetical protein
MKTMMMRGGAVAVAMLASVATWAGDGSDDAKALRDSVSSGDLQPAAAAAGNTVPGLSPGPLGEPTLPMSPGPGDTDRGAGGGGGESKATETDVPKGMSADPESPEREFLHVWPSL